MRSEAAHLISFVCEDVYYSDIQPATDSDETPTPTITFNCLSPDENKTDDNDNEDADNDDAEASLTQYQLSDLSRRLGGTQLYISRDTGLDLTQQLEAGTGDQDTSKYAETMEELEQLMARLEDVFQSFRYRRILTFLSSDYQNDNKLSMLNSWPDIKMAIICIFSKV